MRKRVKNWILVFCLFMFLLIVLGGGLRLNPGGAFIAAATGTPLMIYVFQALITRPDTLKNQHNDNEASYDGEPATVSRAG